MPIFSPGTHAPTNYKLFEAIQGFIQDFDLGGGGGGEQDGSRMIVACEMHACLLGGSGGYAPPGKFIYLSDCF